MTFDFGEIKINVTWAKGVRERESAELIEYKVSVRAPEVPTFKTSTWRQQLFHYPEEKLMKDIAIAMMYTLARAWTDPRGFIAAEVNTAKVFHHVTSRGIEEAEEKAVDLMHFASRLGPFMDDAIAELWKITRRDDQLWQRGPREWLPRRPG